MVFDEIHEGMKVRIVEQRGPIKWNFEGLMDKFKGCVVTVLSTASDHRGNRAFRIVEDPTWIWNPEDCDPADYEIRPVTDEELKSILFG